MTAEITTVVENLVYQKELIAEHGLSFYIETADKRILMDTGQTDNFAFNARKLGIDIRSVDYLVVSHGHYDHTGGTQVFLEQNNKAKIVLRPEALVPKYKGDKYVGMPGNLNIPEERTVYPDKLFEITNGVYILADIESHYPDDSHKSGFQTIYGENLVPDPFIDELFLCVLSGKKLTVVSSCSHNGITNIIETAVQRLGKRVSTVIGGFHTKEADDKTIQEITDFFNSSDIENIGICHCTGVDNYAKFKEYCNAHVFYNYTGRKVTF